MLGLETPELDLSTCKGPWIKLLRSGSESSGSNFSSDAPYMRTFHLSWNPFTSRQDESASPQCEDPEKSSVPEEEVHDSGY